jgi:hypothetical protein
MCRECGISAALPVARCVVAAVQFSAVFLTFLLLQYIEYMSVESVKRTWVDYGEHRDWADNVCGQGEEFLVRATEPKNIWIPAGVSFGN